MKLDGSLRQVSQSTTPRPGTENARRRSRCPGCTQVPSKFAASLDVALEQEKVVSPFASIACISVAVVASRGRAGGAGSAGSRRCRSTCSTAGVAISTTVPPLRKGFRGKAQGGHRQHHNLSGLHIGVLLKVRWNVGVGQGVRDSCRKKSDMQKQRTRDFAVNAVKPEKNGKSEALFKYKMERNVEALPRRKKVPQMDGEDATLMCFPWRCSRSAGAGSLVHGDFLEGGNVSNHGA